MPNLMSLVSPLDALLRGDRTSAADLRTGSLLNLRIFVPWAIVLGMVYGFFMGWFALFGGRSGAWVHVVAVMIKLPALFLCTLLVTFPSLYVFNALLGSRLSFSATLRLLVATIVVNLALAASLGPILGFFTLSTTSYGFMVLLNVLLMGIAGFVSIGFLVRALTKLSRGDLELASTPSSTPESQPSTTSVTPPTIPPVSRANDYPPHPLQQIAQQNAAIQAARRSEPGPVPLIFAIWIMTYGIVGAQMGWILRPFIGAPGAPIEIFRPRSGSVLSGIWNAVQSMF